MDKSEFSHISICMNGKIFNMGLPKTGTGSFCKSMKILGYNYKHWDLQAARQLLSGFWEGIFSVVEQYDAFSDFPWASIYQELDLNFHGSKFVLTQRKPTNWIRSVLNHFDPDKHPETISGGEFREYFFGHSYPQGHESEYLARYHSHCFKVKSYFQGRSDFLVLDLEDDFGWGPLADFLGFKEPNIEFPHVNKGVDLG